MASRICLLLCTVLLFQYSCGSDETEYSKYEYVNEAFNYYRLYSAHKTWNEAEKVCKEEGATLFYPKTEKEFNAVRAFFNLTDDIWLGESRLLNTSVFATVDGLLSTSVYHKWGQWNGGQPDNHGGNENCVHLRVDGAMNDLECSSEKAFICKKTVSSCKLGGQRDKKFFRKDYHFIEPMESFYAIQIVPQTWHDAKRLCEWQGAILFYPKDQVEADAVRAYVNEVQSLKGIWLGISEHFADGFFVTVDGFPLADVYNKWNQGEPNNHGGPEECIEIQNLNDGYLNDVSCSAMRPYICKKTLASLEWNTECNMPYTDYIYNETLGRCYKVHPSPKTWKDAYALCSSELSYLAVIDSQDEADFFQEILQSDGYITSSVPKNYLNGTSHMGFQSLQGDTWKTIKGAPVENGEYFTWGVNQPDGNGVEKCGAMGFDGQLHDVDCDKRCSFICEHEIINSYANNIPSLNSS